MFGIGKLKDEISLSNKICAKIKREFEMQAQIYQHDLETIQEDYKKVVEELKEQFAVLDCLKKIYFELSTPAENFSGNERLANLPQNISAEKITIGGEKAILSGIGAGFGTAAGAVGLMTAFGTASTGTAIASLHGAAYVSSLLAAFGDGSIAAGGLGMKVGLMILGGTAFLPAIAVAGFIANNKIKSAHKKAIKQQQEARRLEKESKIYFTELDKVVRHSREMNFEIRLSAENFKRLVMLSLAAPEIGFDADYQKLLQEAAQVMKTYGLLKVVDENNKINENLSEELLAAKKSLEKCQEHYIEYRVKISPQVLELVERTEKIKPQPLKDEEIRALFNVAVNSAEKELDVTAMKLNKFTLEYIPKFKRLLKKGVTIKIFYGIGAADSEENLCTKNIAQVIRKTFLIYKNFKIKRTNTHAKIFICDDKFIVVSSYNVLSKDGGLYDFGEAGIRSQDTELISHHRKEYFDFR